MNEGLSKCCKKSFSWDFVECISSSVDRLYMISSPEQQYFHPQELEADDEEEAEQEKGRNLLRGGTTHALVTKGHDKGSGKSRPSLSSATTRKYVPDWNEYTCTTDVLPSGSDPVFRSLAACCVKMFSFDVVNCCRSDLACIESSNMVEAEAARLKNIR